MEFDFRQQPGLRRWNRDLVKENTQNPIVTIITPYFNGGRYIDQTCNCVLDQTFPWFEWIIVDDGSTNQKDILKLEEVAQRDQRIRVVHKENGGISSARNMGIRLARAPYVMSLDCDDLVEPTFVEYCWWMLEKNPKAAWAYTDSCGFQDQEYLWEKTFDPELLKKENHLTEVAFIRKSRLVEIGGYAEVAKHYNEDWYMYLRMVANGQYPVQAKNEYLSWYRRRDNGVLSIVEKQNKESDFNERLIENVGKQIIDPHPAVVFPGGKVNYDQPHLSDWNRCVYAQHDKIRLTMIVPWLEMGGADKFNLDLIAGLDKEKFDVSIITTVPGKGVWTQRFRKHTPEIFNLPNFMEPKDYAEFISYFIKSRETDILLVSDSYHGYYLLPWLRWNFPKLAIIDYVHMEEWYWRKGGYARTSGVMGAILEKTYVCNSATRRVMIEKFGRSPESVETLYIGVDDEYFNSEKIRKDITYRRLKIAKGRPIVLFIARLHPQKRPVMMLQIAREVRKDIPNVAFVVVGSGEQEDELKQRALAMELENTVYFAGMQKEVRPFYRDASVTLICSLKEGLALTAYESCSMGVPVVSADVGGQSDLIDETVGALIPCRQAEDKHLDNRDFSKEEVLEYKDALVRILSNSAYRQQLARNARKKIENGFSIRNMVSNFESEAKILLGSALLQEKREQTSQALSMLGSMVGDVFTMEMQEQAAEENHGFRYYEENREEMDMPSADLNKLDARAWWSENRLTQVEASLQEHDKVLARHEEVVNRHEEVVNRHEEVVNRHEEVVNRHEEVVNRHEEVVNRHEQALNQHEEVVNRHEEVVNRHEQAINQHEEVVNRHEEVVNRHEQAINQHEEVVNRHEEVVNRHEEVVNRHEQAINADWAWLKDLDSRIKKLEEAREETPTRSRKPGDFVRRILKRIKNHK